MFGWETSILLRRTKNILSYAWGLRGMFGRTIHVSDKMQKNYLMA